MQETNERLREQRSLSFSVLVVALPEDDDIQRGLFMLAAMFGI
jgi:hypothetical protein